MAAIHHYSTIRPHMCHGVPWCAGLWCAMVCYGMLCYGVLLTIWTLTIAHNVCYGQGSDKCKVSSIQIFTKLNCLRESVSLISTICESSACFGRVFLSVYMYFYFFSSLYFNFYVCMCACLPVYVNIWVSVCLIDSVYLSVCLSVCLSGSVCLSVFTLFLD